MLATKFTEDTPLPLVGSIGYLRGTGHRCRVLRRNPGNTCLVQLFQRVGTRWEPVLGSSGNCEVEERDLYPTEREAHHCGRPRRAARVRKPRAR